MNTHVGLAILLASLVVPSMAPCQVPGSRHWVRLLTTQGETVDMDTVALGRTDRSFIVWLRWDFDRRHEYRVEQIEVDCRAQRERVLSAARAPGISTTLTPEP